MTKAAQRDRQATWFAGAIIFLAITLLAASWLGDFAGPTETSQTQVIERDDTRRTDTLPTPDRRTGEPASLPADTARASRLARSSASSADGPVGIHAFPPLGTRPKLAGIIVPEDFELPPGYIRHFQSSDDGQRLPPILMYDPLNPPLDDAGEPMDIPPDRIVPADRVPAGMPIEVLDLPDDTEPEPHSLRGLFRPD
ncbi:MAG: hypothetical protein ACXIUB_06700 [Wenzhouxiangella sp.]